MLVAASIRYATAGTTTNAAISLYAPDPNHIWNRLHRVLFVRTAPDGKEYGVDQLDPLLWANTKFLLDDPSHERALKVLDEFLAKHAEKLTDDPLKRAILQRDLWAVFDWSANPYHNQVCCLTERQELQARLAKVIQSLAMTGEQLKNLPDNYEEAVASKAFASQPDPDGYLPPDLFRPDDSWVCLRLAAGFPIAPTHLESFDGRSTFLVFMKLPGGREATLGYLKKLQAFPLPWVANTNRAEGAGGILLNPDLPQFPVGTQVALVRQAILIDDRGELAPTRLTESVQIRAYRDILPPGSRGAGQDMFELKLTRPALFANRSGGLKAVATNEQDFVFVQFQSHGTDPFELSKEEQQRWGPLTFTDVVLHTCASCHSQPGIYSVNSYTRSFGFQIPRAVELIESVPDDQRRITIDWKRKHYTWGLLQGLWQRKPND